MTSAISNAIRRVRTPRPWPAARVAGRAAAECVRCVVPSYPVHVKGPDATELIELGEIGMLIRVEGDCVIIQFDPERHPFPVKLPRSHVEALNKLEARGK